MAKPDPFGFDMSVSSDKKKRSRGRRGMSGAFETSQRVCEAPGCNQPGQYRAPKSPDSLDDFYWFCRDHVREYNLKWNFFNGTTEEEFQEQIDNDRVWGRETKPFTKPGEEQRAWARLGRLERFDRMHFYTYPERGDHRSRPAPVRPSFRVAAMVGQANQDVEGAIATLRAMGHLPPDRGDDEVASRIEEAARWLGAYAPDSKLRIELRDHLDETLQIGSAEAGIFAELAALLRAHLDGSEPLTDDQLKTKMFAALRAADLKCQPPRRREPGHPPPKVDRGNSTGEEVHR